jgi:murein DD-endopeptidase MepM/ murein hydrolase activator NlpD
VILDSGHYAFNAHLQPGSLTVAEGDEVSKGQVLGLLGTTGNSDAPHLHFHIMDGPGPLSSNGLPYRFEDFEVQGTLTNTADLQTGVDAEIDDTLTGSFAEVLALDNQLITFRE